MAELDDAELPEFTEEDAAAELGEEAELEAPEESEEVAELDDAELPEFTEEDAAAEQAKKQSQKRQKNQQRWPAMMLSFQSLPKKTPLG